VAIFISVDSRFVFVQVCGDGPGFEIALQVRNGREGASRGDILHIGPNAGPRLLFWSSLTILEVIPITSTSSPAAIVTIYPETARLAAFVEFKTVQNQSRLERVTEHF
jgi:hypothetical protein